jgi:hypothetical protein
MQPGPGGSGLGDVSEEETDGGGFVDGPVRRLATKPPATSRLCLRACACDGGALQARVAARRRVTAGDDASAVSVPDLDASLVRKT